MTEALDAPAPAEKKRKERDSGASSADHECGSDCACANGDGDRTVFVLTRIQHWGCVIEQDVDCVGDWGACDAGCEKRCGVRATF